MLGGDEKHTVLVKGLSNTSRCTFLTVVVGLDFALLEQQKAKLDRTQDMQDEALLEQAFKEATAPKKRTREEIVEKLRKSRGSASSDLPPPDKGLETAKSMGRFRPIGAPVESKVKKRKNKTGAEDADKKSKKRKTEETSSDKKLTKVVPESKSSVDDRPPPTVIKEVRPRTPSPDIDVDVDIFADVGEYRGFGSDSGSDAETGEEDGTKRDQAISNPRSAAEGRKTDWFGNPLSEEKDKPTAGNSAPTEAIKGKGKLTREPDQEDSDMEPGHEPEPEPEQPSRLQPLASSSVPSIREILARDEAAEREEKRKARKEKKKNKKPSETTKINREAKQCVPYSSSLCFTLSYFTYSSCLRIGWRNTLPLKINE
jgi:IK cytokine